MAEHGHEERLTVDDQNVRLKGPDVREPGYTRLWNHDHAEDSR
jgi:hypothetical protein